MRSLAKLLLLCACVPALALAGCGDEDVSSSALADALVFLPRDTPFAVAIDTDVEGDQYRAAADLVGRFPGGEGALDELREQIEQGADGLSFEQDIRPLLGNPFVVGAVDPRSFAAGGDTDEFVGAIVVEDGDKLRDVIEQSGARKSGERSGATLYEDDGSSFAVKGDTLVVAGSDALLEQALERAEGDDHLDEDTFDKGLEGLPEDALLRLYADVQALLRSDPDTAAARKVEWVDALRTLGLTAAVADDQLQIQFELRTDGEGLEDEDLPIASGGESPGVIDQDGEIGLGLRDPAQIVRFAEAAAQAVDPSGFGDYAQAKRQLEERFEIDFERDLLGQLSGDVSASIAVDGSFGLRAELEDPAAFEDTLAKVVDALPDFAEGAGLGPVDIAKPKAGEDFYALAQPGANSIVFGVVDEVFVLANEPQRAGRLARERPTAARDARGAVVLSADAEELAGQFIDRIAPQLGFGGALGGRLAIRPLADLGASIEADTDGLRGRFALGVD